MAKKPIYQELEKEAEWKQKQKEEALQQANTLLHAIHDAQSRFIADTQPQEIFKRLLSALLELTESEYGFIGEVLYTSDDAPYLKTYAITNIAWNDETRSFYDSNAPEGMKFYNLKTLFGTVMTAGRPVISNNPSQDPRRGGLPGGHPPIHAFMGLPFYHANTLHGMVGMANRPGGYDDALIGFLQPFLATCSNLIAAIRTDQQHRMAEEKLRVSEERYRTVVEDMPVMICRFLPDGTLTFVNSMYCQYFGRQREELIGHNFFQFIPAEDQSKVKDHFLSLCQEKPLITHEHQVLAPDGTILWQEWTDRALFNATGEIIEYQSLGRDISDRKRAEDSLKQALEWQKTIFEGSRDTIFISDVDSRFVAVNQAACELTGYTEKELLSMRIPDLHEDIDLKAYHMFHDQIMAGEEITSEAKILRKDSRKVDAEFSNRRISISNIPYMHTTARDISERKQMEAEREALITELETKNNELERFTYTVSHDLKSPLITIKGFLGFLEQDVVKGDLERLHFDIRHIREAADTMYQLLNDLLELSRIGRLMNPPQKTPFADLAQEAVERVAGQIAERGVQVTIRSDLPTVYGDRLRLLGVLQNLLENAIKFMGDQSAPQIEIGMKPGADCPVLYVADNGIGIDLRYHEKVFGLFERLDPGVEGTGVGLALVKRIIEVHGGRIWVESEGPGRGSTFYFTLAPQGE